MPHNGDKTRYFDNGAGDRIPGIGSFHKTLPRNNFGEVDERAYYQLLTAADQRTANFQTVPDPQSAPLVNPRAGLAHDPLTHHPTSYDIPPAPKVLSTSTAAEMVELYWMARLRDRPLQNLENPVPPDPEDALIQNAIDEINRAYQEAREATGSENDEAGRLQAGVDLPGHPGAPMPITTRNVFRVGLPGEELGPLVSQFFLRTVHFGTQSIDQKQRPYKAGKDHNYLTSYKDWWNAQRYGRGADGRPYPAANESRPEYYETTDRYIGTMRDLARFVHKDALHQAYFNAALLLLSGEAKWTYGNPYSDVGPLRTREAGFGTLGGPHILALVSEVATRALKCVWNQKWQVHLRLRPEAYGGLVHMQKLGLEGVKRNYGLPDLISNSKAAQEVHAWYGTYFLPMAFTSGSPAHPAYGAGHATVAGACVTVLKAYFQLLREGQPIPLTSLVERAGPGEPAKPFKLYTMAEQGGVIDRIDYTGGDELTIEGELNKIAANVAMGRSMGGVHWRSDNTRSLMLGEALAVEILAQISTDLGEKPMFELRTFARKADGNPKLVRIENGRVWVDDRLIDSHNSAL
jgi:hypothetical protein